MDRREFLSMNPEPGDLVALRINPLEEEFIRFVDYNGSGYCTIRKITHAGVFSTLEIRSDIATAYHWQFHPDAVIELIKAPQQLSDEEDLQITDDMINGFLGMMVN